MEATDPEVAAARRQLDDTVDGLLMNLNHIHVSRNRFDCAKSCGGPAPHVHEFRAPDVNPDRKATT